MKWFVRGATVVVLLVAMFAVFTQGQTGTYVRVDTDRMNIRTGPGIEYEIIGQAFFGNTFPVIERSYTGNWLHVDLGNGRTGWLFHALVTEYSASGTPIVGNPAIQDTTPGQGGGAIPQNNLGQGGGALPVTTTNVVIAVDLSVFNSTIGVFANVNMRIGPGTNYRVIWVLPYDQRAVPVARNATGSWILVQYNGYEGWVSSRYVVAPPALDLAALPVR
jgi:uncharacterized protein YgiM (DUF1202 family)